LLSFSANISLLFTEVDFLERFARASRAGFRGVECQFPYQCRADEIAEQLQRHAVVQVLHNLPAGDWASGDRGIACLPDRVGEFQDGLGRAIEYATKLQCRRVNCLAGIAPATSDYGTLYQTFVDNLRFASEKLKAAGIMLLIEPLNTRDTPGFFLRTSRQALDIIHDVGGDNLNLQFDVYHAHIMEPDVCESIRQARGRIAHVQIADDPGRHEPGTGRIDFGSVFEALEQEHYCGWIGCEYVPSRTSEASLTWLNAYRNLHAGAS
jgi:hydroxypyruvate isomerase